MDALRIPSPVAYKIYTDDRQMVIGAVRPGTYTYLMAGNGVWKAAGNAHFSALVPVTACRIAGLPPLAERLYLTLGKVEETHLYAILNDARRQAWDAPREAMYHVRSGMNGYRVSRPHQSGTAAHLAYQGGDGADVLMDLHSHCEMPAFFSGTDNQDELGLRLYAVIGRIFSSPEIRVRVGLYGDRMPVPVTAVFEGPGPFQDLYDEVHRG